MMLDRFADPAIAAEMGNVVGTRYACLGDDCTWRGHTATDDACPRCGHEVSDRWEWHAREVQAMGCR